MKKYILRQCSITGAAAIFNEDIRRLEAFSHVTGDEHEIIVADTVCVDSIDNQ